MAIEVLEETAEWLAINKPAGLIVERNPHESPTVESLVYEYLSRQKKHPFLGIVHRLDRVTSGVLLMARKKSALKQLNEQFRQRQVQKVYLARVEKAPSSTHGMLVHWLEKDQKNKKAIAHHEEVPGSLECRLEYRILKQEGARFLLEIHPFSGKFHQIRAQLAAAGCPIAGDAKYGASTVSPPNTIALHAWKLSFRDPVSGFPVMIEAPPPDYVGRPG